MRANKALDSEAPVSELPRVPRHIAIIMDGNNRWARQRKLPGAAGHKAGVESVRTVMQCCAEAGVEVLTLFAFSSENWRRPEDEVSALMSLFLTALKREVGKLNDNQIRLRVIGNRDRFGKALQQQISEAEELTLNNTGCTVVIAADYGGHWDIAQAVQLVTADVLAGKYEVGQITPELIQEHISLNDLPAPDLCIRTGGEHRISNFLLWQMAYTELYFTEAYWPDFGKEEFSAALADFARRDRRFGRTSNKA